MIRRNAERFVVPHHDAEHNWTVEPVTFASFGFVCGCIWGDDTTWKVRFFDLSRLPEGVVVYDERFGYAELNGKLTLAQSVETWQHENEVIIRLYTAHDYRLDGSRFEIEG